MRNRQTVALATFSDTLGTLEGALALFSADLGTASPELAIGRSQRLSRRCAAVETAAKSLDTLLNTLPALRRELATLRRASARCTSEYTFVRRARWVDSLKVWAPYRLANLREVIRRYRAEELVSRRLLRVE